MKRVTSALILTAVTFLLIFSGHASHAQNPERDPIAILGSGVVHDVDVHPTDDRLAIASGHGLWIYDPALTTKTLLDSGAVAVVAWQPDGTALAAAADDGRIWIWDVAALDVLHVIDAESGMTDLAWHPHGDRLSAATSAGVVTTWDTDSGSVVSSFDDFPEGAVAIDWNADGSRLAIAGPAWDYLTHTPDIAAITDPQITVITFPAQTVETYPLTNWGPLVAVVWHPQQPHIVAHSHYLGVTAIWDVQTGAGRDANLNPYFDPHGGIAWSPDGTQLAGNFGAALIVYDVLAVPTVDETSLERVMLESAGRAILNDVAWFSDGASIVTVDRRETIRVWDLSTASVRALVQHTGVVADLAWHPTARLLAATHQNSSDVYVWDVDSGQEAVLQTGDDRRLVHRVQWSPDGDELLVRLCVGICTQYAVDAVAAGDGGNIQMTEVSPFLTWGFENNTSASLTPEEDGIVYHADGEPDGVVLCGEPCGSLLAYAARGLAAVDVRTFVDVYDLDAAKRTYRLETDGGPLSALTFSPVNFWLAALSRDGNAVRVWSPFSGREVGALLAHDAPIRAVAWHPTELWLAIGRSGGADVEVWDVENNTIIDHYPHQDVYTLAWHSDGTLATGGADGTVKIWVD